MQIGLTSHLKPLVLVLCLSGVIIQPAFAVTTTDKKLVEKLSSQVSNLQKELNFLKKEIKGRPQISQKSSNSPSIDINKPLTEAELRATAPKTDPEEASNPNDETDDDSLEPPIENRPKRLTGEDLLTMIGEERTFMPFDLDVPGQAFVSTGPYVGVPVQYAGSHLIINSPSVNTDLQLLGIRKSIIQQLNLMGGEIFKEPYHSHLLLSGLVESQLNFTKQGGEPYTSDIDVTSVAVDFFFLGPSDWLLGFVEYFFDNGPPAGTAYRVGNSRVYVNKAFVTIGNLNEGPFYGSFGQMYVPFGTYSSIMVSDTLPKTLARTKARAIEAGFQQQTKNAFYGSAYIFRGDSHASSRSRINNGGINLGLKFDLGPLSGNMGCGVIASITDSAGMQLGNGFTRHEKIVHRVPAYDARGIFNFGENVNFIVEYITSSTRFNPNDMSFNGHGAKPWAVDVQGAYSFFIFKDRPSSIGAGFAKSHQALSLGLPVTRTSVIFNTSLLRNTLQSIEFRRDRNYAASDTANGPTGARHFHRECTSIVCHGTGKSDYALTAQFDYYF